MSESVRMELRRGRSALAGSAIGISVGPTLFLFVSSLFVIPFESEFGWSRGAIGAVTLAIPASAFFLPVVGTLIDRYGARRALAASSIGLGAGYLGMANIGANISHYYIAAFLTLLLGSAAGPIGYTRIVNSWFRRSRGLALALALAGSSIGGACYPLLVRFAIEAAGWRAGFVSLAALAVAVGLPAILLSIRDGPYVASDPGGFDDTPLLISQAYSRKEFWLLPATLFLMAIPAAGLATQLQPLLVERGAGMALAASLVSTLGISILAGRLVTGFLIDRYWAPGIAAFILILAAFGAALILLVPGSLTITVLGVMLMGLAQGAELDLAAYLTARYFGMRSYGRFFALFFLAFTLALPLGGLFFGAIYDHFGDYDGAMLLSIACFLAAVFLVTRLGRYPQSVPE